MKRKQRVALAALLIVPIALGIGLSMAYNHGTCAWYGYQTERETRYSAFIGCLVKANNV